MGRPLGVSVVSWVVFVEGVISILFGLGGLLVAFVLGGSDGVIFNEVSPVLTWVLVGVSSLFILTGVFDLVLFKSLRLGRNWARIVILVLSAVGVFQSVGSIVGMVGAPLVLVLLGLVPLLINVGLVVYLGFFRSVRRFFN